MKSSMSRFPIHDDMTAPEDSLPILKAVLKSAGQLPNLLGVLGGSPAALRAYARFRAELRKGSIDAGTRERIALAVAAHYDSDAGIELRERSARRAGVGLDEVRLAQKWRSNDPSQAALLRYLKAVVERRGNVDIHVHEEAHEAGWSDEQLLEALALVALESFEAMVTVAGEVPADGSGEDARLMHAA